MEQHFALVLVGLTSVGAFVIGTRGFGLSRRALGAAVARMLESLGVVAVFFATNLLVGGLLILAARAVRSGFVSLYLADDVTVLALSVLQGLIFYAWRMSSRTGRPPT